MRRIVKLIDHGPIKLVLLALVMLTPFSAWAEDYPITVAGVQVTSDNATTGITGDNITGNGSVTYDAENRKLTLNNVEITGFIYSSLAELTIELTGTNTMFGGIQFNSNDVSKGNLNVTGTGSLEMTGQDGGDVVSNFTDVTIGSGLYLQTNEPGTHWDGDRFRAIGNGISSLTITPDVYYPIWVISSDKVHYIQVSGENKGHVLGESNTTVTYDSENDKLILNNFECVTTDGEYAICLGKQEEFKIHLLGENTIQGSGVSFAIEVASLVFSTDAQTPGSLTIAGSYSFTSIGDDAVSYNNGLKFSNNSTKKVIAKPYNLWVNGTQVTSANSQDILSDDATYNKNKISFDGDHTLTLHNIPGTVFDTQVPFIKNGIGNLTIFLDGQNEVNCGVFIEKETDGGDNFTATFVTDSNAPGLLAIISNTEEWYTGHTLECTDPLSLNPTGYTYTTAPKALYATTYAEYDLTIAGIPVTSANAGGVTGDGISGTVTYNATDRILTLNSATISTNDNNPSPLIICNGNLTVDLVGPSSFGFNGSYATYAFKNIGSTGELTFTSTSTTSEYGNYLSITSEFYEGTYKGLCDGFTKVNFNNDLGLFNRSGSKKVGTITGEAPGFYIENGFNTWSAGNGLLLNATYHYKIDYVDTTIEDNGVEVDLPLDETNHNFSGATLKISDLAGPCTITSYAKMDGTIIGSKKAKLFGFTGTKLKVVYDGSETPESTPIVLSPAIEEDDGIEFQEGADISIVTVNSAGSLTPTEFGRGNGYFGLTYTGDEHLWSTGKTNILNENAIVIPVEVVPTAPTIGLAEGEHLSSETVTITSTIASAVIKYKWNDGTAQTYAEEIPVQTGILTAWVEYTDGTTTVSSEEVTAEYTVKTDIATLYVAPIEDITYTGSAVTPTIVVKATEEAEVSLVSGTDYTVSYKQGETAVAATDLINVATYTVVISGNGSYGGTKEIPFNITQAENSLTTTPAAVTELTYTGEAKDLITAGVAKFGDVQYKLGANGTYSTTIPTAIDANTTGYTVYYKVEGTDNYAGIDESSIVVSFAKATPVITFAEESYSATLGESFTSPATIDNWTVSPTASSNTSVANISEGEIVLVGVGTTTITVTYAGDANHNSTTASYQLVVSRDLGITFSGTNSWASYFATENLAVPEGLTAYVVSSVTEEGVVNATTIEYIPANNAVLLERAANGAANGYTAGAYTGTTTQVTNLLAGSPEAMKISTLDASSVYVLYNDQFKRATSGTIPARRAYLPLGAAVAPAHARQSMNINISDGSVTAIKTLAVDDSNDSWYTIDGLKLNGKPQRKGLYINKGKKVYINSNK